MPTGDLLSTPGSTPTKHQFSAPPLNFSLPSTLRNSFSHISISQITNDVLSRRLVEPSSLDKDFCSIQETSFQNVHPATSRHISIKNQPPTKMGVHTRRSSSCSDLKPKTTALKYTSAEEGSGEVLSDAADGTTTNSKAKELNNKSTSQSVPWKKTLQPLPSKKGLVPKGSAVINYSAAINTHYSELSVVESDLKGAMTKRHSHAGFSYQNSHQNEFAFDIIPKAPKLALLKEIPPKSIMPQMPPTPKSLSLDRIPSLRHMHFSDSTSRVLNYKSSNRPQVAGTETPRKRDGLASAFGSLDGEFHK